MPLATTGEAKECNRLVLGERPDRSGAGATQIAVCSAYTADTVARKVSDTVDSQEHFRAAVIGALYIGSCCADPCTGS